MPRKAGREAGREPVETPAEVPGEVAVSDQQLETFERIEELKERFGDDATGRAQIQRRLKDGRLIGLPSIPALTFDTDLVAKRYGGGRYYVRFYQGRHYLGDIEFELDESLKPEPPEPPKAVGVVGSGNEAPSWLAATLDKIGDAVKAMAERPAPTPPTPPDPMAMIEKLAVTMRALTPPERPVPAPGPDFEKQLSIIEKMVNVGTSIVEARGGGGEGGDTGDAYMSTVTKLAEPIIDLVKLRAQQEASRGRRLPRNAVTPQPHLVPTPATEAAAAIPPVTGGPAVTWLLELQRWLPMILKRAQRNLSAEDTAFFILDELSEPTLKQLAELAAMPDFGAQVARVLPQELHTHPEWVTEFLTAIQDYLFGGEDDALGAGGDAEPPAPPEGGGVLDLDAEAKRRLALLTDKPEDEPVLVS